MVNEVITPEMAKAELARRKAQQGGGITPEMAKAELARRRGQSPDMAELSGLSTGMDAPKSQVDRKVRAKMEASKIASGGRPMLAMPAVYDFIAQGATSGLADEISSVVHSPFRAVRDKVGLGEAYSREHALRQEQLNRQREAMPILSTAGELGGALVTGGALAKGGLSLIGRSAGKPLATRIGAGAAEGAAYGGLYGAGTADQGERLEGAQGGAIMGAAFGGAVPALGAATRKVFDVTKSAIRTPLAPRAEARSRIARAMAEDAEELSRGRIDDAVAARSNQPIINADRGGETVRGLARAASNADPNTRAKLAGATESRFASQGDRTVDIIKRVAGGEVDDLAMQDSIRNAARLSNSKAYNAAMGAPQAQQVFTPKLQQILQAPAIQSAARKVPQTSANRTLKNISNPFEVNSRGQFVLRRKADGTMVAPNLGFWDQVKRNLDDQIGKAQRSGERSQAADLLNLKNQLVDELDSIVPQYKNARAGAAAAFGAEDAVDAGRKFARVSRNTPEMTRALGIMTEAEKKAFKTGFASELIDKAKSSNDRVNVIRSMFQSQESREKLALAFGKARSAELEAFVRVETAMDRLRQAVSGNSTTARQLVELGLISGSNAGAGAYGIATGDYTYLGITGGLTAARYGKSKMDERVIKEIGKILSSSDKAAMTRVTSSAAMSPRYMDALRKATDAILKSSGPAIGVAGASLTAP